MTSINFEPWKPKKCSTFSDFYSRHAGSKLYGTKKVEDSKETSRTIMKIRE